MNVWYDSDGDGQPEGCSTCYEDGFGTDYSQDFHIFKLIWDKNRIDWYLDDVLLRTDHRYWTILGQPASCWLDDWIQYQKDDIFPVDPMKIILNLAIQSGENEPDEETQFPQFMEVDYVRYYQRKPCVNININDYSEYPLDAYTYNAIVGLSVNINCDYPIYSGEQLVVIAKNYINLGPGFLVEPGSSLNLVMDPSICQTTYQPEEKNKISSTNILAQEKYVSTVDELSLSTNQIQIFPNPFYRNFNINLGGINLNGTIIRILNTQGVAIQEINSVQNSESTISMTDNQPGIYFLIISNVHETSVLIYKLIKLE